MEWIYEAPPAFTGYLAHSRIVAYQNCRVSKQRAGGQVNRVERSDVLLDRGGGTEHAVVDAYQVDAVEHLSCSLDGYAFTP